MKQRLVKNLNPSPLENIVELKILMSWMIQVWKSDFEKKSFVTTETEEYIFRCFVKIIGYSVFLRAINDKWSNTD